MYAGDFFHPPHRAVDYLGELVGGESALVWQEQGKDRPPALMVHPWPSWLTRGSPRVVDFFIEWFYHAQLTDFERAPERCHLCHMPLSCTFWEHIFSPCKQLHTVCTDS